MKKASISWPWQMQTDMYSECCCQKGFLAPRLPHVTPQQALCPLANQTQSTFLYFCCHLSPTPCYCNLSLPHYRCLPDQDCQSPSRPHSVFRQVPLCLVPRLSLTAGRSSLSIPQSASSSCGLPLPWCLQNIQQHPASCYVPASQHSLRLFPPVPLPACTHLFSSAFS